MELERRRSYRTRPKEIPYILFEQEGGGIVLNASEQGLAFHTAAVMRKAGAVRLCISPNPMQQIKLVANIVWIDETKKSGGLRFTELSTDAANQIRQWLTQTIESGAPDKRFAGPSCALMEETDSCSLARNITPYPQSEAQAPGDAMSTPTDARPISNAPFFGGSTTALSSELFLKKKETASSRPQLLHRLATMLLIFTFGFVPFLFLHDFRREIGNSLIRLGEKLRGDRDTPPHISSSIPVQISNPSSESAPPVPNPIPATRTRETIDQSDPAASTRIPRVAANSTNSPLPDRHNSRENLADARSKGGRNTLARQLWSAIEAGDTSAEVSLAQLYLKGDGVPRNCEQARVLLKAASKNGDIQAMQQLKKLNSSGCRWH